MYLGTCTAFKQLEGGVFLEIFFREGAVILMYGVTVNCAKDDSPVFDLITGGCNPKVIQPSKHTHTHEKSDRSIVLTSDSKKCNELLVPA